MTWRPRTTTRRISRLHARERQLLFVKLGLYPGYAQLSGQQQLIVDRLAVGRSYAEIGAELGVSATRVQDTLHNQILPAYRPAIWQQATSLAAALQLIADEVNLCAGNRGAR